MGAFSLALTAFAVAMFLILKLDPASATGWVVYAVFLLGSVVGALLMYRGLMGSDFGPSYPDAGTGEGYAPGIMVGAGGQRRRREDDDLDAGIAKGEEAGADIDDPSALT